MKALSIGGRQQKKAGGLLLDNQSIKKEYIADMIASVHEFGPYIVIAPGIALFHARPEGNVNEICLSYLRLKSQLNLEQVIKTRLTYYLLWGL